MSASDHLSPEQFAARINAPEVVASAKKMLKEAEKQGKVMNYSTGKTELEDISDQPELVAMNAIHRASQRTVWHRDRNRTEDAEHWAAVTNHLQRYHTELYGYDDAKRNIDNPDAYMKFN